VDFIEHLDEVGSLYFLVIISRGGHIPMVHSMQFQLYIVGIKTTIGPPQTSFHMTSLFRRHSYRLYCDVSCGHMSSRI
jgi:hypothetical protein